MKNYKNQKNYLKNMRLALRQNHKLKLLHPQNMIKTIGLRDKYKEAKLIKALSRGKGHSLLDTFSDRSYNSYMAETMTLMKATGLNYPESLLASEAFHRTTEKVPVKFRKAFLDTFPKVKTSFRDHHTPAKKKKKVVKKVKKKQAARILRRRFVIALKNSGKVAKKLSPGPLSRLKFKDFCFLEASKSKLDHNDKLTIGMSWLAALIKAKKTPGRFKHIYSRLGRLKEEACMRLFEYILNYPIKSVSPVSETTRAALWSKTGLYFSPENKESLFIEKYVNLIGLRKFDAYARRRYYYFVKIIILRRRYLRRLFAKIKKPYKRCHNFSKHWRDASDIRKLKLFLSPLPAARKKYHWTDIPCWFKNRVSARYANKRRPAAKKKIINNSKGLFSSRSSPFVSYEHMEEFKVLTESAFIGFSGGVHQKTLLKKFGSYPKSDSYPFKQIYLSKKLFWRTEYSGPNQKVIKGLNGKEYLLGPRVPFFARLRAWRKRLFRSIDLAQKHIYITRPVAKFKIPFIKDRNSAQETHAALRGFDGLYPWSVNYLKTSLRRGSEFIWDPRSFKKTDVFYSYFHNSKKASQPLSALVNSITGRSVNLRLFGKLINTEFSNFLKDSNSDLFTTKALQNLNHPNLVLYNKNNTALALNRSKKLSGFFPFFSNVITQEVAQPALKLVLFGGALGWERQTGILSINDIEADRKVVVYDRYRTNAFYETRFNKFWNINFHKHNIYAFSRSNYKMFGGGVLASNFLLNYEAAISSNFNNFYSTNRFAVIKLLNSLVTAASISDSMPSLRSSIDASIRAVSASAELFDSLKRRARWDKYLNKPADNYKLRTVFGGEGNDLLYSTSSVRSRIADMIRYSWRYQDKRAPYKFESTSGPLSPRDLFVSIFRLRGLYRTLALLKLSKAVKPLGLFARGDWDAYVENINRRDEKREYLEETVFKPLKRRWRLEDMAFELKMRKKYDQISKINFTEPFNPRTTNRKLGLKNSYVKPLFALDVYTMFFKKLFGVMPRGLFYSNLGGEKRGYKNFLFNARSIMKESTGFNYKLKKFCTSILWAKWTKINRRRIEKRKQLLRSLNYDPRYKNGLAGVGPRKKFLYYNPNYHLIKRGNVGEIFYGPRPRKHRPLKNFKGPNRFNRAYTFPRRTSKSSSAESSFYKLFRPKEKTSNRHGLLEGLKEMSVMIDRLGGKLAQKRGSFIWNSRASLNDLRQYLLKIAVPSELYLGMPHSALLADQAKRPKSAFFSSSFSRCLISALRPLMARKDVSVAKKNKQILAFSDFALSEVSLHKIHNIKSACRSASSYFSGRRYKQLIAPYHYYIKYMHNNSPVNARDLFSIFNIFNEKDKKVEEMWNNYFSVFDSSSPRQKNKFLNLNKAAYGNFKLLSVPSSKAIGFHFLRFSLSESVAARLGDTKLLYSQKFKNLKNLRKSLLNLVRFNKNTILRKKNVEAKGRSVFNYFTQKKSWYHRKWNRPYFLMASVSTAPVYPYSSKMKALTSVYGFRKFAAARKRMRAKHYRQKVFIKKILRRRFACNMSSLHTRWRVAKETKRKWFKYYEEFESRLANTLCLMGYYSTLKDASRDIETGGISVNNFVCINPDYRVKPLDVISLNPQLYIKLRAKWVSSVLNVHLSKPDVSKDVKYRILDYAAEFLKTYSAVARLRGEGHSVTKFLFFQKLLAATVTKLSERKKRFKKPSRDAFKKSYRKPFNARFRQSSKNRPNKFSKGRFSKPFIKKPKKRIIKRSEAGFTAPTKRLNYYSKGDLGTGAAYEKIRVRTGVRPASRDLTPTRIRRLLMRALKSDVNCLSSSFSTANDIFCRVNNVSIYLRRPHTINEMFEKSSIGISSTYNSEVIEEFYTSRFWK